MCAPGLRCRLLLLVLLFLLRFAATARVAPSTGAAQLERTRTRRGLTYPGTLWCGAGSNADAYEQLGKDEKVTAICSPHPIPSWVLSTPAQTQSLSQRWFAAVPTPMLVQSLLVSIQIPPQC